MDKVILIMTLCLIGQATLVPLSAENQIQNEDPPVKSSDNTADIDIKDDKYDIPANPSPSQAQEVGNQEETFTQNEVKHENEDVLQPPELDTQENLNHQEQKESQEEKQPDDMSKENQEDPQAKEPVKEDTGVEEEGLKQRPQEDVQTGNDAAEQLTDRHEGQDAQPDDNHYQVPEKGKPVDNLDARENEPVELPVESAQGIPVDQNGVEPEHDDPLRMRPTAEHEDEHEIKEDGQDQQEHVDDSQDDYKQAPANDDGNRYDHNQDDYHSNEEVKPAQGDNQEPYLQEDQKYLGDRLMEPETEGRDVYMQQTKPKNTEPTPPVQEETKYNEDEKARVERDFSKELAPEQEVQYQEDSQEPEYQKRDTHDQQDTQQEENTQHQEDSRQYQGDETQNQEENTQHQEENTQHQEDNRQNQDDDTQYLENNTQDQEDSRPNQDEDTQYQEDTTQHQEDSTQHQQQEETEHQVDNTQEYQTESTQGQEDFKAEEPNQYQEEDREEQPVDNVQYHEEDSQQREQPADNVQYHEEDSQQQREQPADNVQYHEEDSQQQREQPADNVQYHEEDSQQQREQPADNVQYHEEDSQQQREQPAENVQYHEEDSQQQREQPAENVQYHEEDSQQQREQPAENVQYHEEDSQQQREQPADNVQYHEEDSQQQREQPAENVQEQQQQEEEPQEAYQPLDEEPELQEPQEQEPLVQHVNKEDTPLPLNPNIVIFLADGISRAAFVEGESLVPNLMRIAEEGVYFSDHMAGGVTDTSSRAALMTGRLAVRYGMALDGEPDIISTLASQSGLPPTETTFASVLQKKGYATALIGKWNLGMSCESLGDLCHHPNNHGFDHYFGMPLVNHHTYAKNTPKEDLMKKPLIITAVAILLALVLRRVLGNLAVFVMAVAVLGVFGWTWFCINNPHIWSNAVMRNGAVVEQPADMERMAERMVKEGVRFLRTAKADNKPFLLVVSSMSSTASQGKDDHKARLQELDQGVGEVLRAVQELGLDSNTLTYFTSTPHVPTDNQDEIIQEVSQPIVPALLRWPSVLPAGLVVRASTSHLDVMPTLVQVASGTLPGGQIYDGRSLLPRLRGGLDIPPPLFVYCGAAPHVVKHTSSDGKVYVAHLFPPQWSHDAAAPYCKPQPAPAASRAHAEQQDSLTIYELTAGVDGINERISPSHPIHHMLLRTFTTLLEQHRFQLEEPADNQFTWYKQSWHAYLQPKCAATQEFTCTDSVLHQPDF